MKQCIIQVLAYQAIYKIYIMKNFFEKKSYKDPNKQFLKDRNAVLKESLIYNLTENVKEVEYEFQEKKESMKSSRCNLQQSRHISDSQNRFFRSFHMRLNWKSYIYH